MNAPNVLSHEVQSSEPATDFSKALYGPPNGRSYRAAIAQIIKDLKALHKLSNETLAERIGSSETSVYNWENENGSMEAVTLLRIAFEFGEEAIALARQLYLCKPAERPSRAERFRRAHVMLDELEREGAGV